MLQWAEFRVVVGIVSSKKKKGSLLWQKGERTIRAPLIAVSPRRAALQFRRALHSQHFVFCYSLSVVVLVLFLLGGVQLWLDLKNQQCASDNQKLEIKKFILFTKKNQQQQQEEEEQDLDQNKKRYWSLHSYYDDNVVLWEFVCASFFFSCCWGGD